MVDEGLVMEVALTDCGMSMESEMMDEGLLMEVALTDKDMSLRQRRRTRAW